MKKTIIAAAALVALAACNKTIIETPVSDFGYISIDVSADSEMVVTKAEDDGYTEVTGEDLNNYLFTLNNGSENIWDNKKFSEITDEDKKKPSGQYTMTVKSISDAAAVDGNGAMQLVGTETFTVQSGEETPVTVLCSIANTKVTVALGEGFGNENDDVFTVSAEPVTLTQGDRDEVSMTPGAHDAEGVEEAWFNAGAAITWKLTATVRSTSQQKTYTGTIEAEDVVAKKWNQLTFKAGTNGNITLTVKVDNTTISVEEHTPEIDPLGGANN